MANKTVILKLLDETIKEKVSSLTKSRDEALVIPKKQLQEREEFITKILKESTVTITMDLSPLGKRKFAKPMTLTFPMEVNNSRHSGWKTDTLSHSTWIQIIKDVSSLDSESVALKELVDNTTEKFNTEINSLIEKKNKLRNQIILEGVPKNIQDIFQDLGVV